MTSSVQKPLANDSSTTASTDQALRSRLPQCAGTGSQERGNDKTSQPFIGCTIPIFAASNSVAQPFNATSVDALHTQPTQGHGNDSVVEGGIVDEYDFNWRALSINADSLDSVFCRSVPTYGVQLVIIRDPMFDDPGVCEMIVDVTPSIGPYWHKRTARIVEGKAEIKPEVTEVLARVVAAGL
ncbi:hypothetical protein BDD12DRAFT_899780 [Trichophaea hybrida]|nr:hypothetical protein BDD12DRAFT_899780 [Trichophaea hybrida]